MTKRTGNFNENASKKLKVEDNIDALWGEDLDADDVDDCLLLASQICEQNLAGPVHRNNVSILPSYSFFKQNGDAFTSTQCHNNINNVRPSNHATTSKFTFPTNNIKKVPANLHELQKKIEKLEGDHKAKDGEVSILRSQLKQIKISLEAEHRKKEQECNEKLQSTRKELISTKSELDFKNLEVANLRNKIAEVTKSHGNNKLGSTKVGDEQRSTEVLQKLDGSLEEQYPLRDKIDPSIFSISKQEHFYINCKRNKFNAESDRRIIEKHKANVEYNNFKLDSIFPCISALSTSSRSDLNSEVTKEAVDKILFAALEVTRGFYNNLTNLERDIQEETIRQRDLLYLDKKPGKFCTISSIFGAEEWFKNEIGIKSRRIIVVLAEILPYSAYLRQLILQKSISLNTTLDNFFNLVHSVVKIIGVLRIPERCVGFLCAVVIFMTKCTVTPNFCDWYICIGDVIKEIVFTRPPRKTLEYLSEFLKQSSLYVDFIRNMCRTIQSRASSINSSHRVLYYNEESCLLKVFTILYSENLIDNQDCETSMAILEFIKHVLSSNVSWTHYNTSNNSSNDSCNCLRKILKLGIKIVHQVTKSCIHERKKYLPNKELVHNYENVLKFSIDLLHIIKFQHMDIFNKYSVISQYKFLMKTLLEWVNKLNLTDEDRETLKELNLPEELQGVNDGVLSKIPIWD